MSLTAYDVEELQTILLQHTECLYLYREAEEFPPVLMNEIFKGNSPNLETVIRELEAIPSGFDRHLRYQRILLDALERRMKGLLCIRNLGVD